jgi:ureidoglycolate lyase
MRKTAIRELSLEDFQAYGSFADMIDPEAGHFGEEPVQFFRDMVQLDLGGKGTASFSVCRVRERPLVVEVTEHHSSCGEGILPLDSDVLIHVGPASRKDSVPLDEIEVFRVPRGTLVTLRPGVWHHAPFAYNSDKANVLIVLPERTYANDCSVYEIPEDKKTEIEQ